MLFAPVAGEVVYPQIVREDENDVRRRSGQEGLENRAGSKQRK
jgi:hypothetical protein